METIESILKEYAKKECSILVKSYFSFHGDADVSDVLVDDRIYLNKHTINRIVLLDLSKKLDTGTYAIEHSKNKRLFRIPIKQNRGGWSSHAKVRAVFEREWKKERAPALAFTLKCKNLNNEINKGGRIHLSRRHSGLHAGKMTCTFYKITEGCKYITAFYVHESNELTILDKMQKSLEDKKNKKCIA